MTRNMSVAAERITTKLDSREAERDDTRVRRVITRLTAIAVAPVVAGGFLLGATESAPTANADEQVFVGGNCDPGAGYVSQFYRDNGMANPNARQVNINYPATIGPICGPTPMRDSVNIGADAIMNEYRNNAPGEQFYVEGFSLGAATADEFGRRITNNGTQPLPPNVHIINSGDGYNATGILNHPLAPLARIVTDPMGIPSAHDLAPVPGTLERFDVRDFWGNGGTQGFDIGALIGMLSSIGTNHRIPNPNEPHVTFQHNGVTYEVYGLGDGDPITQAIQNAGVPVPEIGRLFFGLLDGPQNPAADPRYTHSGNFTSHISETAQTLTTPYNMREAVPEASAPAPLPGTADVRTVTDAAPRAVSAPVVRQQPVVAAPKPAPVTRTEHVVTQVTKSGKKSVVRPNVELVATPKTTAHGIGNKKRR